HVSPANGPALTAAWPATRNSNALAMLRALVRRLRPAHPNVICGLRNLDKAKTCVEVPRARVRFQNGEFDTRLCRVYVLHQLAHRRQKNLGQEVDISSMGRSSLPIAHVAISVPPNGLALQRRGQRRKMVTHSEQGKVAGHVCWKR